MTRLERILEKRLEEKSLGPGIGEVRRNYDAFTARDADLDLTVLEDIPTVNFGRGVPDPTPGNMSAESLSVLDSNFAVAAMSSSKNGWAASDPTNMDNPDGYFPKNDGPLWKSRNHLALNVAPRSRRGTVPASVNNYFHVEWTEHFYDAIRDQDGTWNVPPPQEMEVERAIYDALKRETIEVGGYTVPYPKYPKETDYYQEDMGYLGYVAKRIRPSRGMPFGANDSSQSWTDGHPLYHSTPTGLLQTIVETGLVGTPKRPLYFASSPSVWNDEFPHFRDNSPNFKKKGMSFLRISPTDEMNEKLSRLAEIKTTRNVGETQLLALGADGELVKPRNLSEAVVEATINGSLIFGDLTVPASHVEVLNQNGEWISLLKADLSDSAATGFADANAGMAKEKNRGIRRILRELTGGEFGRENEETSATPSQSRQEQTPQQTFVELPVPQPKIGYSNSYGGDDLIKNEQSAQRIEHEDLASSGQWGKIHSDHYDWWAYPIDRGSAAYGETFNVAGEPIERLKTDQQFLSSLAREIEIQALALGWSLYDGVFLQDLDWENGQDWRKAYPTRLWKMTRSAQIFGLEREFESLLSLQSSLEAAGIRFNHSDYWNNPGTIDDVPSLGKTWQEREESRRFAASDAASYPFGGYGESFGVERRRNEASVVDLSPRDETSRTDENRIWDEYDSYEPVSDPILSDAEELADLLSEPNEEIEFGYPYERIDKETRQLIADDIYFAISLLMDGVFPDEEITDRRESAQQMRQYAEQQEGLYPDDGDILYALAEALEDPNQLELSGGDDADAGMSSELVRKTTDEASQLDLMMSLPEVAKRVRLRDTEGRPASPGRNAVMKPYLLAPHVDVNNMSSDDPVIKSLAPALGQAGLGSYPVEGHRVPKVQGPVVRELADRLIGPNAVADAVSGTFPTADEILTIYAVNALIRARAEYLANSTLNADQINTAILNGVGVGRQDAGGDAGGMLWTPSVMGLHTVTNVGGGYEARFSGTIDPFAYFTGRSDFLRAVIRSMPESVKSKVDQALVRGRNIASWEDVSFFETINVRENDEVSRKLAPMVRLQAGTAIDHARRHEQLTKRWAQIAYDMMKEAGLTDDEVAFVINEHWAKASSFPLDAVRPGSVTGSAARLAVKALSARYSPITRVDGRGEEEDYGLHEFFHHYLGQGFTRHGEYVAFRGPMNLIDSYHGHLQWAWGVHGQLGMFVSKVMREAFGDERAPGNERTMFDSIARAIYDRLRQMLSSSADRTRIMQAVFPEFLDATTEDEAKIKELIRRQFAVRDVRQTLFRDYMPALRLMTAQAFLVPKEYWPYGGTSKIKNGEDR